MELTVGRMQGCYSFHSSPPHHQIQDNSFTVGYSLNCLKSTQNKNAGSQKLLKHFSYSWPLLWVIKFTFDCDRMLQHVFKNPKLAGQLMSGWICRITHSIYAQPQRFQVLGCYLLGTSLWQSSELGLEEICVILAAGEFLISCIKPARKS